MTTGGNSQIGDVDRFIAFGHGQGTAVAKIVLQIDKQQRRFHLIPLKS